MADEAARIELSESQLRELQFAALGMTCEEAGAKGHRSVNTVRAHRNEAIRRIGGRNIAHAVHLAHVKGLL